MNELDRLKEILKNSFAGLKRDMDELKEFRTQQLRGSYEFKQEMDSLKENTVSKDRLNLLKIKIGEINDSLKKLWDIEEELKKLDNKTVSKSLFEQRLQEFNEDVGKSIFEIKESVAQLRENSKQFVTKPQINGLIDDMNDEFNMVHAEIADLKKKKDILSAVDVKKKNEELNKKIELLAKELIDTNKKVALTIKKDQVEDLVKQIDGELEDIKSELYEIQKLKKYMSLVESDAVKHKDLQRSTKNFEEDISDLKDDLGELKKELKNDLERKVKGIEKKEIVVREEKRAEKKVELKQKEEKPKKPYRKTMIFGNILIGLAFVLLIFAIIAFFAVEPSWADLLSIISIVSFVIGILLRVFVVLKRK